MTNLIKYLPYTDLKEIGEEIAQLPTNKTIALLDAFFSELQKLKGCNITPDFFQDKYVSKLSEANKGYVTENIENAFKNEPQKQEEKKEEQVYKIGQRFINKNYHSNKYILSNILINGVWYAAMVLIDSTETPEFIGAMYSTSEKDGSAIHVHDGDKIKISIMQQICNNHLEDFELIEDDEK